MNEIRKLDIATSPGPVFSLGSGSVWPIVVIRKVCSPRQMMPSFFYLTCFVFNDKPSAFVVGVPLVEGWLALPTTGFSNSTLLPASDVPRHLVPESLRELQKRPLIDLFVCSFLQSESDYCISDPL